MSRGAVEAVTGVQRAAADAPPADDRPPRRPPRRPRTGAIRRKMRRGYADKAIRPADYDDKGVRA